MNLKIQYVISWVKEIIYEYHTGTGLRGGIITLFDIRVGGLIELFCSTKTWFAPIITLLDQ